LSNFGSGIAKDRSDAPGLSVGVDECAAFNPVVTFPVDGCPKVTVESAYPVNRVVRQTDTFFTASLAPSLTATIAMSAASPMKTPSTVRAERSGSEDHHRKAQKGAGGTHLGTLGFAPVE
jgi:hypothetical protein